jgi:hypothetical protein
MMMMMMMMSIVSPAQLADSRLHLQAVQASLLHCEMAASLLVRALRKTGHGFEIFCPCQALPLPMLCFLC